ncbi:hypothetical protein CDEF62S_04442 [Castellaniella defragrans]
MRGARAALGLRWMRGTAGSSDGRSAGSMTFSAGAHALAGAEGLAGVRGPASAARSDGARRFAGADGLAEGRAAAGRAPWGFCVFRGAGDSSGERACWACCRRAVCRARAPDRWRSSRLDSVAGPRGGRGFRLKVLGEDDSLMTTQKGLTTTRIRTSSSSTTGISLNARKNRCECRLALASKACRKWRQTPW